MKNDTGLAPPFKTKSFVGTEHTLEGILHHGLRAVKCLVTTFLMILSPVNATKLQLSDPIVLRNG